MPSPAITAMRAAEPPARNGLPDTEDSSSNFSLKTNQARARSDYVRPFHCAVHRPWSNTMAIVRQHFLAHCPFFDQVQARRKPNPRTVWDLNHALLGDRYLRFDNVLAPVAFAGGDISRQREIGKRRERDVMDAADTRLQHTSAPDRHAVLLAKVVNEARLREAPDTSQLDIDNAASSESNRGTRLPFGMHTFVEANRRDEFVLELHM